MRPQIVTALSIVLGATAAHAQTAASCNLPHGSGVSSQQLLSGQRPLCWRGAA